MAEITSSASADGPQKTAPKKPPEILSFGIPSLDELLGCPLPTPTTAGGGSKEDPHAENYGILVHTHDHDDDSLNSSTSLCLIGPDGTGKSVLALHLAAQYASTATEQTRIFYASTDLSMPKALSVWHNFALKFPNKRHEALEVILGPSRSRSRRPPEGDNLQVLLQAYTPIFSREDLKPSPTPPTGTSSSVLPLTEYLIQSPRSVSPPQTRHNVAFIDLESNTAGDDWGLINRLLATLERPEKGAKRNLLIVDAVEGLEMFGGRRDAYGHQRDRRSRIAQVLRAAKGKCHVVFIVEEPRDHERLPEEFVCDAVIRLRVEHRNDYARRTIEIEKLRGQTYVRGRHDFLIRKGAGSRTGTLEHADDPVFNVPDESNQDLTRCYFQVIPSLHYLSRELMEEPGTANLPRINDPRAVYVREQPRGLCGFGVRYLDEMIGGGGQARDNQHTHNPNQNPWTSWSDPEGLPWGSVTALIGDEGTHKSRVGRAFLAHTFQGSDGKWTHDRGVALLLTMHPLNHDQLAEKFVRHLGPLSLSARSLNAIDQIRAHEGRPLIANEINQINTQRHQNGLPNLDPARTSIAADPWKTDAIACMKERTFCRRLEIHNMTPAILFHIIHSLVQQGLNTLGVDHRTNGGVYAGDKPCPGQVRLVIDDWNSIRNAYSAIRDDPLFLPFLLFYFQRQGITALLIDTQPGRLSHILSDETDRGLRSLVQHHIYTWHVTFFGEKRVAIAALPPISDDKPVLVRELHPFNGQPEELLVDPHFEYYTGFVDDATPELIPLRVHLFADWDANPEYKDEITRLFGRLFARPGGHSDIIVPEALNYDLLRESTFLQGATALDHSLVLQVDEFWLQDSDALLDLHDYLHAATATGVDDRRIHDPVEDRFRLFQPEIKNDLIGNLSFGQSDDQDGAPKHDQDGAPEQDENDRPKNPEVPPATGNPPDTQNRERPEPTTAFQRFKCFQPWGFTLEDMENAHRIDRIPYTVDFGFLMADRNAWLQCKDSRAKACWDKLRVPDPPTGRHSTKSRPTVVSWFDFLKVCGLVARDAQGPNLLAPRPPFDVDLFAHESLSCLVLEIFASELDLLKAHGYWDTALEQEHIQNYLADAAPWTQAAIKDVKGHTFPSHRDGLHRFGFGLAELCRLYRRPLFRAWLLLASVWWPDPERQAGFRLPNRPANPAAIASRHWYSTACPAKRRELAQSSESNHEPLRLPGTRSVRGDWFLGIARGSRSKRLAHRAIDLLCSRRGNLTRMQLGLGLPTRGFLSSRDDDGFSNAEFRSPLSATTGENFSRQLQLRDFWALSGVPDDPPSPSTPDDDIQWIWRSSLKDYDRHSRLWIKWLTYTFDQMEQPLRQHLKNPKFNTWDPDRHNLCLELYEALGPWAVDPSTPWPNASAEYEGLYEHRPGHYSFKRLCKELEQALQQASIPPLPTSDDNGH